MGYQSIVPLALIDGIYELRCVEVGSGGANSDAQISNTGSLKEAIDDETIGIPPDVPLPFFHVPSYGHLWGGVL